MARAQQESNAQIRRLIDALAQTRRELRAFPPMMESQSRQSADRRPDPLTWGDP